MKLKQFLSSTCSKVRCVFQVISQYGTSDSQYLFNTYIQYVLRRHVLVCCVYVFVMLNNIIFKLLEVLLLHIIISEFKINQDL